MATTTKKTKPADGDLYEIMWDDEIRGTKYKVLASRKYRNKIIWTNPDTGKRETISRIALCWQTTKPFIIINDMRAVLK